MENLRGKYKFLSVNISVYILYYRSNCKCDEQFYNCLKKSATTLSKAIGKTYFNILQPQCFKLEHPSKCLKILR